MYRIALVIDYLNSDYSQQLYKYVNDYSKEYGFELLVFTIGNLNNLQMPFDYQNQAVVALINKENVDGVIVSSGSQLHFVSKLELLTFFKSLNVSSLVSVAAEIPDIPSVTVDCSFAYEQIIDNALRVQKCKKIALLGVRSSSPEVKERRNAIKKILEDKKFPMENFTYFRMNFEYLSILKDLETYTLSNNGVFDFDFIIAFNDEMALAASEFCKSKGLKVPDDVLITGFDNCNQTKLNTPSLSSVDQHLEVQTRLAVEKVIALIEEKTVKMEDVVTATPVFRDSTKRVPYDEEQLKIPGIKAGEALDFQFFSKNTISDWYLQRAQIAKITKYYSETQFDMTMDQLKARINTDFRAFGIKAVALVIYDSPVETPIPFDHFEMPNRASLFCAFDETNGYDSEIVMENIKFNPKERILPDGVLNYDDNGLVTMAVYHNVLQYGYFVFRPESGNDFIIYEFIEKVVSSMVDSVISYARVASEQNSFRKKFKELDIVVNTDEMTGLYNRRGLFDFGQATLSFAKATNQKGLIVYGDIDGLKKINDGFGHEAGDKAIIAESIILKGNFRSNDIIARIGGDEFVIISPGLNEESFERIKNMVQEDCELWTSKNPDKFMLSISLGFVKYPSDKVGYQITPLLSEADANLYIAKRNRKK